jgi:hypothetical protein
VRKRGKKIKRQTNEQALRDRTDGILLLSLFA